MQIIRRSRLGNDTEDITLLSAPRTRGGQVAIMDGYDVLSVPSSPPLATQPVTTPTVATASTQSIAGAQPTLGPIKQPASKLFDVLALGVKAGPRGIAYAGSRQQFAFNDPMQPTLFFTDARGVPQTSVDLQFPNDQPVAIEGLGYIPANAPAFPDTLVMAATFADDNSASGVQSRLEIINFDGSVVAEIVPQGGIADLFLTGVCFKSPGSLLVSSDDDETIHEIGFKGNLIANFPPLPNRPGLNGIEGLTQLPTGEFGATGGFDGLLAVFTQSGASAPQFVDYQIGLGLSLTSGLAWDSTTNQFLVIGFDRQRPGSPSISSLAPLLDSFRLVVGVDPTTRKLTYIPGEQTIAAAHPNNPRGILLFKKGQPAGQIDTSQLGNPVVISFIPTTNEFVLVFANQRTQLSFLSRQGAISRKPIDLAPAGIVRIAAVTFFNPSHPSGGQFLVFDNTQDLAVITDLGGNKLDDFSIKKAFGVLNPSALAAITTGSDAGAFALANSENSEIVVFRLN
jgi:hypothetical protein